MVLSAHHSVHMRRFTWGVFLVIFVLTCPCALAAMKVVEPGAEDVLSMVPDTKSFRHFENPIDYYRLFDSAGNPSGVAVITTYVPPHVGGYIDEIALLVGMNESGQITGVKLLAHQENQEYIDQILSKGFLNHFLERDPTKKWDDIETVTGATISANAMRDDIHTASLAAVEKVLKSGIIKTTGETVSSIGPQFSRQLKESFIVVLLVALATTAVFLPRYQILRRVSLLLSFIIIGPVFNIPITIGNFVELGQGSLPNMANLALSILLIFAVAAAFIKGPVYCSYLCPFGALQDGASALKTPKCSIDDLWMRRARRFRWIILIVTIIAIAGFNLFAFRKIEPFALCFTFYRENPVWPLVIVILIASLFLRRPWCRLFCPTGLLVELFSKTGGNIRTKLRRIKSPLTPLL